MAPSTGAAASAWPMAAPTSPPPASPWAPGTAQTDPQPWAPGTAQTDPQPWAPGTAQTTLPYGGPGLPPGSPPPGTAIGSVSPGSRGWRRTAVAGAAAVAIALGAGGVGGYVGYALHPDTSSSAGALQNVAPAGSGNAPIVDRSSLASIAASVQPTVVVIQTGNAEGSGVVLTSDGYIVTNNHVVSGATGSTVKVTFNSGKQVDANIVGTDVKTDLAVVKASVTGLRTATWGNSDDVQVGDTVLAIGSPLGLQGSVTAGIVSALHRTITVGGDQQSPFEAPSARTTIGDAIQTDAPINPGNSGGALVSTDGKVIGINSAIATSGSTGNIGVGFAISSNKAKAVAEQLIKGGKVSHPYLGVSVGNASNGGAQIQQVVSGSPAEKAGLREGDVVVKINDRAIASREDLVGAVQASSVGATLVLTIDRDGSESTVSVTVGEAP